jgi:hypothetical protein
MEELDHVRSAVVGSHDQGIVEDTVILAVPVQRQKISENPKAFALFCLGHFISVHGL